MTKDYKISNHQEGLKPNQKRYYRNINDLKREYIIVENGKIIETKVV